LINIKDHNQQQIFDLWKKLGPKRRRLLDESWAGLFRKVLLHKLPVKKLAANFTEDFGRPTKELTTCMGVCLFQQIFDLTDIQTQERLAFDVQWHYALNLPEKSDDFKYISLKTIWTMRKLLTKDKLEKDIFKAIGDRLAEVFDVDTDKQRIDSVHIKSNMKKLGRISVVVETTKKFIRNLKRQDKDSFSIVRDNIIEKYSTKESKQVFAQVKPSESAKTLQEVCEDLLYLVEQFKNDSKIERMNSYQLMERVLEEQCNLIETDGDSQIEVKRPQDIPSGSLQNPSDPDATYDGHKGQGYQVQVMETYDDSTDSEGKEDQDNQEKKQIQEDKFEDEKQDKNLSLATHVAVEPAHRSDSAALLPAIESTDDRKLKPKEIEADSAYGGDDNVEEAKKQNVDIISPLKGRPKESDTIELGEHEFDQDNEMLECSGGQEPVKQNVNGNRHSVAMDIQICQNCDQRDECSVAEGNKFYYFRYTDKQLRTSKRRIYEDTKEFKDKYRYRAGVEATMSEYDRKTGVKKLRVRGLVNVCYAAIMKLTGINIFRATRYMKAKIT